MAIQKMFEITYKCGHTENRDLSAKPAGERAGFAAWLGKQSCFECHKQQNKGKISAELQKERAENLEHIRAEAVRLDLAVLTGSEKQIEWALRVRHELLEAAYTELVMAGRLTEEEYTAQVMDKARLIDRARWWIDNREAEGGDLPELLADPGVLEQAATSENPY